jgi:1,4-alpha-glucan branching enzyme
MPLAEHPFGGSWGYQISGYYAPTARFGHPDDLRFLIDYLHQQGIGVLVDWVPGHFPRDAHALARFDGTALYEHADPRQGAHPDWGTLVFNFGRNEVRNFLIANALFWIEEYHVDGLRVDAVASMLYLDYSRQPGQWVPNRWGGRENEEAIAFMRELNALIRERHPGVVMIAEESTAWPKVSAPGEEGGLGYHFKWNMGWMHDTLSYFSKDPLYRRFHHNQLTFGLLYAYSEHFVLPLSHDEVVHGKGSLYGKMPGDPWRKRANLRSLFAWMWAHPGKKLLFMGGELGQPAEWNHDQSLDWHLLETPEHGGIQRLVCALNATYREDPALYELDDEPAGFQWIQPDAAEVNVFAFLRRAKEGPPLICVANLSPEPRHGYRIGLPALGRYVEVLNTDASEFGGSGVANADGVVAEEKAWDGQPASAELTLPPLGVVWLRPEAVAPVSSGT